MTAIPSYLLSHEDFVVAYHSGDVVLDRRSIRPFLHLGTLEQARSRAGRIVTKVTARVAPCARVTDRGENSWRTDRLARHERACRGWIVYLNRFEGLDLDRYLEAKRTRPGLDELPDSAFRRLVPSARDSLVLLDPLLVISCEIVEVGRVASGDCGHAAQEARGWIGSGAYAP